MRLTRYYLPALKETPVDAETISHQYMLRSGLIRQTASGIYSWLPLGLLVLKNIENIIRDEMGKAGSLEILMPCVQPANLWRESGRYDDFDKEMLHIKDRNGNDLLFGPTHETPVTDLVRNVIKSYKDLPLNLYQIQWKFRDEMRPRHGVMRGREFLMKDAYSFDVDPEAAIESYDLMYKTYIKIFKRMGLSPVAVRANTGQIGGNLSHEFHILADTGDSTLYYDSKITDLQDSEDIESLKNIYAVTSDMYDPETCLVPKEQLKISKGIEIAHIFHFGDKYSKPMNAKVSTREGKLVNVQMGSYGIGISRLVGAIIEACHDDKGIIWPEVVAPFRIGIVNLLNKMSEVADRIHATLRSDEVLYDDTSASAGVKFSRMDLIGVPWQIIVGKRAVSENIVEVRCRATGNMEEMMVNEVIRRFAAG